MSTLEHTLAQHAETERFTKPGRRKGLIEWAARCVCGHELSWNEDDRIAEHRAHVADAIRTHLTSQPVIEAASDTIRERMDRGTSGRLICEYGIEARHLAAAALAAALNTNQPTGDQP